MIFLTLFLFFSSGPNWTYDYDKALQAAESSEKDVLIVFSGSDWCKPCIQLHRSLFETKVFIDYANENLILVKADFPYAKRNKLPESQMAHNEKLAAQYNESGAFPLGVFVDNHGKELGRFTYDKDKSPADYLELFNKVLK